jgi:hypothetical protein
MKMLHVLLSTLALGGALLAAVGNGELYALATSPQTGVAVARSNLR